MIQYLQNNVVMKWNTHFTSFNGWIPLIYGLTRTPPIINHFQKPILFHIAISKTSNIRCTLSFDQDEFSKRISIIRHALYWRIGGTFLQDYNKFGLYSMKNASWKQPFLALTVCMLPCVWRVKSVPLKLCIIHICLVPGSKYSTVKCDCVVEPWHNSLFPFVLNHCYCYHY